VFITYIFLVFGLDSLSVGLALNFFFRPVNYDVLGAKSFLRRQEAFSYLRILGEKNYTSRQYNNKINLSVKSFIFRMFQI
jgi:hypothetical protein